MAKEEFEKFITDRFLDFYNREESTHFEIKAKADEKEREKSTYDYYAVDKISKKEMAIEIKRLIPKEKKNKEKIKKWVEKYINNPLKSKIKGDFSLLIKAYEDPFPSNRRKRMDLFKKIREEILALDVSADFTPLKSCPGMSLLRWDEKGNEISAWPFDYSTADENEIVRMIDSSLTKFEQGSIINIVFLIEHSPSAQREKIRQIIEDLEQGFKPNGFKTKKRNFNPIDGIYHIALHKDAVIARVFPNDKIFETGFFNPNDFMKANEFREFISYHLR
jgi:hypothetical protein